MRLWLAFSFLLLGASGAEAKEYHVVIDKMRFAPVPGLRAGDTILWINRDIFRHSVTARDKSFDVDLPAGKMGRTVLRKAGNVTFFCRYHPGMTGQIVVEK